MQKKFILLTLTFILFSCSNSTKVVDCDFVKKMVDLSSDELAIHINRDKKLLTIDDRKKLMEIDKKGKDIIMDIANQNKINNQEDLNLALENLKSNCSDFKKIKENTDIIEKIKKSKNLNVTSGKEIESIATVSLTSPCDYMEFMLMLGNLQLTIYEKENGNILSDNEINIIEKIENKSDEISSELFKKYSEIDCKKCSVYSLVIDFGEKLKSWKNR